MLLLLLLLLLSPRVSGAPVHPNTPASHNQKVYIIIIVTPSHPHTHVLHTHNHARARTRTHNQATMKEEQDTYAALKEEQKHTRTEALKVKKQEETNQPNGATWKRTKRTLLKTTGSAGKTTATRKAGLNSTGPGAGVENN